MGEDFYETRNSIYCYKGSDVLINKLGIKNMQKLFEVENNISVYKSFILRQKGITGKFNKQHFISIHQFLFEDLYPFAGKLRRENIAKDNFRFAEWQYIEEQLESILENLKQENDLKGQDKSMLAKRLAYYMAELNVLHPFRER